MKMIKNIVSLLIISSLCCSCAIPIGSYKRTTVKAVRTDELGNETERVERISKYRKWQYIISPEGPVRANYFSKSRTFIVGADKEKDKIRYFNSNDLHDEISYYDFFPIADSNSWIALGVRSTFRKEYTDINIVKFNRSGVQEIIPVTNCIVYIDEHKSRKTKWEHKGDVLQFETKTGTVTFDLSNGKLIEPAG